MPEPVPYEMTAANTKVGVFAACREDRHAACARRTYHRFARTPTAGAPGMASLWNYRCSCPCHPVNQWLSKPIVVGEAAWLVLPAMVRRLAELHEARADLWVATVTGGTAKRAALSDQVGPIRARQAELLREFRNLDAYGLVRHELEEVERSVRGKIYRMVEEAMMMLDDYAPPGYSFGSRWTNRTTEGGGHVEELWQGFWEWEHEYGGWAWTTATRDEANWDEDHGWLDGLEEDPEGDGAALAVANEAHEDDAREPGRTARVVADLAHRGRGFDHDNE